jgi:uncharacterized membrane protein
MIATVATPAAEVRTRVPGAGHAALAVTLIGVGIAGMIRGDFAHFWEDVPERFPGREAFAYVCACVAVASGAGLLWPRAALLAARGLLVWMLLWLLVLKARFIVAHPVVEGPYQDFGQTLVMVAAAWVLYAERAAGAERQWLAFATGERGVRIARVLYALALIAFGLSHFAYLELTAPLVPNWLPGPVTWSYFTGGAYLAAAAGMLSGVLARPAAVLSALQMAGFTFLVWVPLAIQGRLHESQWTELVVSWALTASAWVVADSYHHIPWLIVGRRRRPSAIVVD